jgi:hypothetical protein
MDRRSDIARFRWDDPLLLDDLLTDEERVVISYPAFEVAAWPSSTK